MIRILLSLAVAAAAFFGPWILDESRAVLGASQVDPVMGSAFIDASIACIGQGDFMLAGESCAPSYGLFGKLVLATVVLGVVSAALSIIGLLPLIGRLTSVVTIISGAVAVVTFAWFGKEIMSIEAANFSNFQWGAYATAAFGLLTIFAGISGMRGERD